jgi:hypothetical protein
VHPRAPHLARSSAAESPACQGGGAAGRGETCGRTKRGVIRTARKSEAARPPPTSYLDNAPRELRLLRGQVCRHAANKLQAPPEQRPRRRALAGRRLPLMRSGYERFRSYVKTRAAINKSMAHPLASRGKAASVVQSFWLPPAFCRACRQGSSFFQRRYWLPNRPTETAVARTRCCTSHRIAQVQEAKLPASVGGKTQWEATICMCPKVRLAAISVRRSSAFPRRAAGLGKSPKTRATDGAGLVCG